MASPKKKATQVKKKVTKTKKSVAKKKKSLFKTTTPQDLQFESLQFESLIQQTMRQVGPKKFHLDPAVYTKEYFRKWLPAKRRKANVDLDYIPDYHHLKNLPVWDHTQMVGVLFGITWQGYLELVPQWPFGPATFSEMVVAVRKKSDKFELEPEYRWSPEIKGWYLPAVEAITKFEEILRRGTGHIPGVVWKDEAYFFTIKDFIPWLNQSFGKLEWLKEGGCQIPIPEGLEGFLSDLEEPENEPDTDPQKLKPAKIIKIPKKAGPDTPTARQAAFKQKFRSIFNKIHKGGKGKTPTLNNIRSHTEWPSLQEAKIDKYPPESTLYNWLCILKKPARIN